MKTFTTYAEKKAKQFLNLLQGYTKGIRFTAILILLLMGVNNAWGTTIYLKPNSNWTQSNARFAAYFFGNGEKWVSMTCYRDFYSVEVPSGFTKVIFCRMNPSTTANNWNNKWNQSGDLTIPTNGNNLFTVPSGAWDGSTTKWSKHTPADQVVYLKPTDLWNNDGARFAAYAFNGCNNEWIDLDEIGCAGEYYTCTIPDKYHQVIFGRMAPNGTNGWTENTQIWNKSGDLTIDNGKCYTISSTGNGIGTAASGSWETYSAPSYEITLNPTVGGLIQVTPTGGSATNSNTSVTVNTKVKVTLLPNTGYATGTAKIKIGSNSEETLVEGQEYTVCGPVDITAHFVTKEEQVVYLRPNDNWLAGNALFYAYAFNRYGDDKWIELTTEETDYTGAFGGTIPAGYSDVIFVRLNPNGTDNSNNKLNFNNAWNQTIDYVIPINTTNNRFIIGEKVTSGSDKDKYKGSWEASDTPIWSIPGDWTGDKQWTAENATPLYGPNGNATLALQASITTEFKLYQFPYGTQERQWYGHAETLVRGNSADKEFTTGTDNCQLVTDIADDYIFAFNIRNKKLTVTYPLLPTPAITITSEERVFENLTGLRWVENGTGTEDKPYQLYADEAARITVSPLPEVEGLTAYYTFGNTAEQTSNIFDWKGIYSTATNLTVTAYYKNANGAKSEEATVTTSYFKTLPLPFNLMTQPKDEINVDQVAAGKNITVQFRSDAAATVGLFVKINDGEESKLEDITNQTSVDYTHDVDDNIGVCILHYIARSTQTVNGRTFEAKADVVIYKNVIIKVNDPDGWVKNVYTWRDYSDAVLTPWPGDPVLQNYGTWRVFSVKYPYYDRFIINDGNSGGSTQTLDWILPDDDTCYELLAPANNGSDKAEDKDKYGLKIAECPGDLIVSDIKDITIMEGEQIVVMPEIFVGLGYKLSDIEADITSNDNTRSVRAMMSGTNITVLGTSAGVAKITVTYTLNNERIDKTFKVNVEKKNAIKIQVKVPIASGGTYDNIGWSDNSLIKIHYWFTGKQGDIPLRYVFEEADKYKYLQAEVPLDANGKTNFLIGYNDINENWEKTADITNVTTDGCYTLKNAGYGNSPTATRDGEVCWDENDYADYQVKVLMQNGKTYLSNITYSKEAILSFFAPGKDATGRNAGAVMLYRNGKLVSSIAPDTFDESNVYIATVNETGDGLENVAPYTGNYYIRTWGTSYSNRGFIDGHGWNSIKDLAANEKDSLKFTYFISRENEFYNHYWVQAMNTGGYDGKDVSACVANEYNDDLAGKLTKGKGTNEDGDIKVGTGKVINVRFGYDPRTNYFGRAIIKGSEYDNYLNIHCDNAYKDKNCSTKLPYGNSVLDNKMQDISNWVYQRDFYVPITNSYPSASLYVEATSPSTEMTVTDHLLGYVINEVTGEESTTPIQRTIIGSGTNNGTYLMRVVYDFKTNRIIAAWLPQGTIEVTQDQTLHSDVLFVRKENNEVPQIQLANDGKIRSLETMYFALELERGDTDKNKRHQEQYWFTLPFDCVVGSISGVPGYMKTWGIQRYRGDLRAQKGWFIETPTFWEWLDLDDVMHAGEGYLLVFDKKAAPWEKIEVDKYDAEGHIMQDANGNNIKEEISMMRLYFPSTTVGFDMQQQSDHLTRTYENHPCTITLHDRYKQDSNWKVIGTTSYNNAGITGYVEDTNPEYEELNGNTPPNFRYAYEYTMSDDNKTFSYKYTPEDGKTATYKSFFGYMVQFAGTISWQPIMSETVPEGIAARRRIAAGERTSYTTRLELANAAGEKQDQAFVALDEKATTGFDQNKDLNKVINRGNNIYTMAENIAYAGNTLPMKKQTVPVGVVVATAGEYTFRMPDGTDGISVILLDNQTGAHTNMLYDEYTVILEAGTYENRFSLSVDPNRSATSVDNVGDNANGDAVNGNKATGVKKFIIDGQLFIRTADDLFDAQGHRL